MIIETFEGLTDIITDNSTLNTWRADCFIRPPFVRSITYLINANCVHK